jgi:hypothetical protein
MMTCDAKIHVYMRALSLPLYILHAPDDDEHMLYDVCVCSRGTLTAACHARVTVAHEP